MTAENKPLVSIILPAYNHENYVLQTLDSILNQDYPNLELIVINDGSPDGTHQVITDWIATHEGRMPVTYRNRENCGITATLNELLSLASGSIIAGASSDDYLLPGSITCRVDYLLNHPSKKAVFGDCVVVDAEGSITHQSGLSDLHKGRKKYFSDDASLKLEMLFRFCVGGPVLMFDRTLFDLLGTFDERLAFEDWDMYVRMSGNNLLGFLDVPVAAYRWHDACVSRNTVGDVKGRQYQIDVLEANRHLFLPRDQRKIDRWIRKLRRKIRRIENPSIFSFKK